AISGKSPWTRLRPPPSPGRSFKKTPATPWTRASLAFSTCAAAPTRLASKERLIRSGRGFRPFGWDQRSRHQNICRKINVVASAWAFRIARVSEEQQDSRLGHIAAGSGARRFSRPRYRVLPCGIPSARGFQADGRTRATDTRFE